MLGGLVGDSGRSVERPRRGDMAAAACGSGWLVSLTNRQILLVPSQIRLLEVARALVGRPTLLLLDEPLAGLDTAEVQEFIDILRAQHAAGLTIVLVDHAVGTVAKIVDRLVVIDNGVLIADGVPPTYTVCRGWSKLIWAPSRIMLTIEHLDAGYRRVRVLYDITVSVGAGETVGVLGPNGAGKTTLLRAIAGNCTVYAGRLEFDGIALSRKTRSRSRVTGHRSCSRRPPHLAIVER